MDALACCRHCVGGCSCSRSPRRGVSTQLARRCTVGGHRAGVKAQTLSTLSFHPAAPLQSHPPPETAGPSISPYHRLDSRRRCSGDALRAIRARAPVADSLRSRDMYGLGNLHRVGLFLSVRLRSCCTATPAPRRDAISNRCVASAACAAMCSSTRRGPRVCRYVLRM
jgi:hypothetical protein